MPEYVYRHNTTGEERSIFMGMRGPGPNGEHPEAVSFRPEGGWDAAIPADPLAWRRVYGNTRVNSDPVTRRYPIASCNLPKNLAGEKCDKNGRVIIRNREHERRLCEQHGYQRVED